MRDTTIANSLEYVFLSLSMEEASRVMTSIVSY